MTQKVQTYAIQPSCLWQDKERKMARYLTTFFHDSGQEDFVKKVCARLKKDLTEYAVKEKVEVFNIGVTFIKGLEFSVEAQIDYRDETKENDRLVFEWKNIDVGQGYKVLLSVSKS